MKKFLVLFTIPPEEMDAWMASTDEQTRGQQTAELMAESNAWVAAHQERIADVGAALGRTKRVTSEGVTDTRNGMYYTMTVLAESADAAAEFVMGSPDLKTIGVAYAEVMELVDPASM